MKYTIRCLETNSRHTRFNVFDPKGANCGTLTVLTEDIVNFCQSWNGNIYWAGHMPEMLEERPVYPGAQKGA